MMINTYTEKEMAQAVLDVAEFKEYFGDDEVTELFQSLKESDDITNGSYRIIKTEMLQIIMADELTEDPEYVCTFSAYFLADLTEFSLEGIDALRDAGCYQDIHDAIHRGDGFYQMAREAISMDGAGHFFAHYDGHEIEIGEYSLFRVR